MKRKRTRSGKKGKRRRRRRKKRRKKRWRKKEWNKPTGIVASPFPLSRFRPSFRTLPIFAASSVRLYASRRPFAFSLASLSLSLSLSLYFPFLPPYLFPSFKTVTCRRFHISLVEIETDPFFLLFIHDAWIAENAACRENNTCILLTRSLHAWISLATVSKRFPSTVLNGSI